MPRSRHLGCFLFGDVKAIGALSLVLLTMTSSNRRLPRWATLIPRAPAVGHDPVSIPEEEAYVRTRCFHRASRALDVAFHQALKNHRHHSGSSVSAIQFHTNNINTEERSPPLRKRSRLETNDDGNSAETASKHACTGSHHAQHCTENNNYNLRQRFTLQSSRRFHPRLLPLHLLSGPSNALDRLAWMKHLVDLAQRETKGAIVWLQQGRRPTSWVTEILRQLYILEPPLHLSATGIKELSVTENLLHWCRATQKFQYIQIYLDMQTVDSASAPVNQFLHWLAHARAQYGIPFSVVLLQSSGPRRHDICSYEQNTTDGIALVRHALPSSMTLLKDLLLHPLVADLVSLLLLGKGTREDDAGTASQTSLLTLFESTGSTVLALLEWKRRLANHLSSPGSFLTLDWDTWLAKERGRLEWMLSAKHVGLTRILKDNDTKFDWEQWQIQARVKRNMAVLSWQIRNVVIQNCHTQTLSDPWKTITNHKLYLEPLAKVRSEAALDTRRSCCFFLAALNELIVLLDNCTNMKEILQCLDFYQRDWNVYTDHLPLRVSLSGFPRPAQPRRDLVEGLLLTDDENETNGISRVPGTLYSFLKHRVSIGFSEWLKLLSNQEICQELDASETAAFFATGVNMLKVQGLIRERKLAGRNDALFEKTAVVFSSGA